MIKSFKCKNTEKLFNDLDIKNFRGISRSARIKLEVLNAAVSLNSLRVPPGNRLEQPKGNRKGQHNIGLMINGVFVLYGKTREPLKLRLLIITRGKDMAKNYLQSHRAMYCLKNFLGRWELPRIS